MSTASILNERERIEKEEEKGKAKHKKFEEEELASLLTDFRQLSKTDQKKAVVMAVSSFSPGDKEQIAEQGGILPDRFIARSIIIAFLIILIGSFLAFVVFSYLGIKDDLLFTLITTTGGFLAGVFVPSPSSLRKTNELQPGIPS